MVHNQAVEKLIRIANQIATFFLSQAEDVQVEGVATHIDEFLEPSIPE